MIKLIQVPTPDARARVIARLNDAAHTLKDTDDAAWARAQRDRLEVAFDALISTLKDEGIVFARKL